MIRKIQVATVRDAVAELCGQTNIQIDPVLLRLIKKQMLAEKSVRARDISRMMIENAAVAEKERLPLCQDTGMVVVFLEVGQDVHLAGGDITAAVNEGVRRGYRKYFLRKSVVGDALLRKNTGDNAPAVIHFRIVPGKTVKIVLVPKGFGSENMSALAMLPPGEGREGIKRFALEVVKKYGPNACPPLIVGIGVGGTFEKAALLAKEALTLPFGTRNRKRHFRQLEEDILAAINRLGIGPQGLGGSVTALDLHILDYPTHIAGLPVAVNLSCYICRQGTMVI